LKFKLRAEHLARMLTEHGPVLYQTAYRLLGQRDLAEDVIQNAFIKLQRQSSQSLDTLHNERAWLITVISRLALDQLRARRAQPATRPDQVPLDHNDPTLSDQRTPDRYWTAQHDLEQLRIGLSKLSPKAFKIMILRHVEGLSYQQIADQLTISRNQVGVQIHRAHQSLTQHLSATAEGAFHEPS